MKNTFLSLQLLSCFGLIATELAALDSTPKNTKKTDACANFQRGDDPLTPTSLACNDAGSYNSAGNIKTSPSWDVYGDVSYIYWFANQNGLDLAATVLFSSSIFFPSQSNGYTVFQNSDYTSGFKVGLGANLNVDDWVVDLEYTYLRQTTNNSSTIDGTLVDGSTPYFKFMNWFTPQVYGYGPIAASFQSKWKLGLDWLDLSFKRPFYQSRRLVVASSAGLRASWIRQNMKITAPDAFLPYNGDGDAALDTSHTKSNSWAIGPRGVVETHWLLGMGFRFEGSVGGSLLYTQFTTVSHTETGNVYGTNHPVGFSTQNYSCLRPMLEADLGIGWGRYFAQNRYHWDLAFSYDFNYLFGQNMMRYLLDINSIANTGAMGDLYLHGLTIKTRFDF